MNQFNRSLVRIAMILTTMHSSVLVAQTPPDFTLCANEGQSFTLPGPSDVAYGGGGQYLYRTNQTGVITFTNGYFGNDPLPGYAKQGYYKLLAPANVPVGPTGYTWCATEGGSFTLPGPSNLAYGANGLFNYSQNRTGSITFTNGNFGDPIGGVVKNGFYELIVPGDIPTAGDYTTWTRSSSFFINTTPSGANVAAGTSESNFPILLRLNASNFNFSQAQSDGRDVRFATPTGAVLSYQIEQWDATNNNAAIWVKIPTMLGNARQEVKMYWGRTNVTTTSSGAAVFNAANGYAGVLHMNETVTDAVGNLTGTDTGTTLGAGMIGKGRYFPGGKGLNFGSNNTALPSGSSSHSTQAWFRGTAAPSLVVGWGVDGPQGKLLVQFANPPHMNVGTWFSGGDVESSTPLATSQWVHVTHTYEVGKARLYVNGVLDASTNGGTPMNIPTPSRMYVGGFYDSYQFVGEIDEVRISNVARSANWIKMEYENQRPQQTLVGNLLQAGSAFSVSATSLTLLEGASTTITGQAGGAQQVLWIEKRNGLETVIGTNQFTQTVIPGRVAGNTNYTIQFKAIYATSTRTIDVPVTVIENQPDPMFTLTGPATWDGRQTISIAANLTNLTAMQTTGVGGLNYSWKVNGVAVSKQIAQGILTLTRAQGNGLLSVTLVIDNGGEKISQTKVITVQQPVSDAWVQRSPSATEKPVNNQFFARDATGYGTIHYNGSQSGSPSTVFLKVYTTHNGEILSATYRQVLVNGSYSLVAPILPGKAIYKVQYGTTVNGVDTAVGAAVTNLICGDAYIIEGQSNAAATDNSAPVDTTTDPWIRTYGLNSGWGNASAKGSPEEHRIGVWGLILAKRLSANYNMPICIINGAVGGTRIDQHQPNPAGHGNPGSLYSIYANLYNRVVGAKLTHGVRALLWHQGEQDQGSGGPDGDYDYKFYQQYFVDISAAWKQDFPNILNYYVFQIWPSACGDTSRNDQLREVQRTLSRQFSNMRMMSTLGISPGASCHYSLEGYQVFSNLISPLVEQDHYGTSTSAVFTAANLIKAYYTSATRNEVALEFDQNMAWNPGATGLFTLDGVAGNVVSGNAVGKIIKLQLSAASAASTIKYIKGGEWYQPNIIYGSNGVAALTFADVPIGLAAPLNLAATAGIGQVSLSWTLTTGASGYVIQRSLISGGPYTVLGNAISNRYQDSTATNGTAHYYVVAATLGSVRSGNSNQASATPASAKSAFLAWSGAPGQGLIVSGAGANDSAMDDPDHDGIPNLLEMTLGGSPMTPSQSVIPTTRLVDNNWIFEYERSDISLSPATVQTVEYGSDLNGWTSIAIPTTSSGPAVIVTENGLTDHVKVTIPATGNRLFFRLKTTMP